jgi:pimeloyl-ACP methyl ester carboxylesterase
MTTELVTRDQADEVRSLAKLGFGELGGAIGGIGQFHRGIAERVFWALGPMGTVAKFAHDGISTGVYAGLRGATSALGRGADAALALRDAPAERVISTTRSGAAGLAALTGLIGDTLEREGSDLAEAMAVRVDGRAIALDEDGLARAFPRATGRLVVFLHGLMETEFSWRGVYGASLARELGYTPVYVRYNSGRHVSENGRSLADLLAELHACWPAEVETIALVGHSMGGLVARSACHCAAEEEAPWVKHVRHVVSLGTPHMGAPLEQAVHYASAGLHRLPETRPLATFLRRRSGGIRDLRRGSLVDEDWRDLDRDALRVAACKEIPLLDGATHCFVSATITRSERHPIGRLLGDILVLVPSASGRSRTRRIPFRDEDGMHLGSAHHFALLAHPAVEAKLHEWLAVPAPS